MSRDESSTKKRRLESEVSQSSGITYLSNITQTTEPSSDLEDNSSDSLSSGNQTEILYDRCQSITNTAAIQQMQKARATLINRQFGRKRQVSWSQDNDETFVNDERDEEDNLTQQWEPARYDNNIFGTKNNRRRVRRFTESSLDTSALSFNKSKSPLGFTGEQHNYFQPKLRSNTTSQIHGHEDEIQRQIDELIRRHDAQELQTRRSQSVTSLRNDRLHTLSDGHWYESVQPNNTAQIKPQNVRHVDTTVVVTSKDSNYLHPVTETKIHGKNSVKSEKTPAFSCDRSSAYADVMQHDENSTGSQGQKKSYDFCDNSFYRRGFYILLMLNLILVFLTLFGLTFVYFNVKQSKIDPDGEVASALRSEFCLDCDKLHVMVKSELSSELNTDDKRCCVKSAEKLLSAFLKIVDNLARVPRTEKSANIPAIQVKAKTKRNSDEIIVWKNPEINTIEATGTDTTILVPKTGYYYVYSRVHYKKTSDKGSREHNGFSIGHTIMKTEKGSDGKNSDRNGKILDKIDQRCFPSNTTGDIIHTNQLGFLHHFKEGDSLFVKLNHGQYFVYEDTLFGMFMVAT